MLSIHFHFLLSLTSTGNSLPQPSFPHLNESVGDSHHIVFFLYKWRPIDFSTKIRWIRKSRRNCLSKIVNQRRQKQLAQFLVEYFRWICINANSEHFFLDEKKIDLFFIIWKTTHWVLGFFFLNSDFDKGMFLKWVVLFVDFTSKSNRSNLVYSYLNGA